ncbi:alpha/beta-hydrolase [Zopfia rhizophila CBS 207.26]|uniref:Carboxylic ester hydrolase n=1 Tax=Zopfia rhizophila CBS 207.26 TaxID=1314779 RepID=A0A6A6DAE2_9PEZI|nr:alpha/beta-hydrolase [Zopfia rhizophila CBS 207.26]
MRILVNLSFLFSTGLVNAAAPSVKLKDGTVTGSSDGSIDTFLGVPFAEPPIGPLRLTRPQPLKKSFSTLNATSIPRACPQKIIPFDFPSLKLLPPEVAAVYSEAVVNGSGEDCLTLNIQRPADVSGDARLPVLFWIYGGAFVVGTTQWQNYSNMVKKSMELGEPIIVVQANYRLNTFGFLGGIQLKEEGNTNLGLHDQRLALQWVADNIRAFGGDPEKVTIWGESAGAMSVFNHLIINGGDNTYEGKQLFRAAIMNSGASGPADPVDGATAQSLYDNFVKYAGCGDKDGSLRCLRELPYESYVNATNALTPMLSTDEFSLAFVPRPDPSDEFFPISPEQALTVNGTEGPRITKVAVITGNQEDEGTFFSIATSDINSTTSLVAMLQSLYPNAPSQILTHLTSLYPEDPNVGSPFRTNSSNDLYPGFKRNGAIVGDLVFQFQRRAFLEHISHYLPTWSFQASYMYGFPYLGTAHGLDLAVMASGEPEVPYNDIVTRYIGFVNYLDPNALFRKGNRTIEWPEWSVGNKVSLQWNVDGARVIRDDYRNEAYAYFLENQERFRF